MDKCLRIYFELHIQARDNKVLKYNFSVFNLCFFCYLWFNIFLWLCSLRYTNGPAIFIRHTHTQNFSLAQCVSLFCGCWPITATVFVAQLKYKSHENRERGGKQNAQVVQLTRWVLLFTNFLHSTRNIFPFFFHILPCSMLNSVSFFLLLARQNLMFSWFQLNRCFCSCDLLLLLFWK